MFELPTPPPCIFCEFDETEDVTPEDDSPAERQYACPHCFRRFAVAYVRVQAPANETVH